MQTQRDSHAYLLNPWAQVGGTLIEAGVLDEVSLALGAHGSTVIPVEVVQVRVIFMGLLCGVGRATGVGTPWLTLETEAGTEGQAMNYKWSLILSISPPGWFAWGCESWDTVVRTKRRCGGK